MKILRVLFAFAFLQAAFSVPALAAPLSISENIGAIWADKNALSGELRFVVIGDSRSGDAVYEKLLQMSEQYNPLFIVNTGDMVPSGQKAEFDHYGDLLAGVAIPVIHVPGNHDVESGTANYRKYFGESNWYFDYGQYRFIGLDNSKGTFSNTTLAFAEKYLDTAKTAIVFFHKPPPEGRWKVHSMDGGAAWVKMKNLIADANAPYVIMGHIHLYDEMDVGEVKYIISAGGGAGLYGKYGFGRAEHGMLLVKMNTGGVSHEWIPLPR